MGTKFRPYDPDQILMLPPDLRDWLPEGHLAHHVSDLVDAVKLSAFYAPYEGDGRRNAPYDPRMMVKVLIYGYATGTFSSRKLAKKLAKKLEEDVAFRMLAAGNFPKHRTLCEFRRQHLADFRAVFAEVVALARASGLAGLGRVAVDGTKVRANASKRKAMSYGRMVKEESRLAAEIEELVKRAESDRRSGGRALWPGSLRRRVARGAEASGGPAGGDPGGEGAPGSRSESGGCGAGPQAGAGAQVEGWSSLQAGVGRAEGAGAEQLHGSREPDHEDIFGAAAVCGETPEEVLADAGYGNEQDLRGTGAAGRGRVCGAVPGGEGTRQDRSDEVSGQGAHGRQAGDGRWPKTIRPAKVARRGAHRLDQGGAGL